MADTKQQKKVILWATSRSISTAFYRAVVNRPKTKGILEPYYHPFYLSADRISKRFQGDKFKPIEENCTFADIKKQCEQDYPVEDYDLVFIKNMAYMMQTRISTEHLPQGFHHTFILRHPRESMSSLVKIFRLQMEGMEYYDPVEAGYKELYQIFQIATEQLGQEPVVVDFRDLLNHPEATLRTYCDKVGITFHPNMLNWSDKKEDIEEYAYHGDWFKELLSGTSFRPYHPKPLEDLTDEMEATLKEQLPYYEKLLQHVLKIDV